MPYTLSLVIQSFFPWPPDPTGATPALTGVASLRGRGPVGWSTLKELDQTTFDTTPKRLGWLMVDGPRVPELRPATHSKSLSTVEALARSYSIYQDLQRDL